MRNIRKSRYRFSTHEEFLALKNGCSVYYMSGMDLILKTKAVGDAFWNSDADEPGWEIETEDGYLCECDIMIKQEDTI